MLVCFDSVILLFLALMKQKLQDYYKKNSIFFGFYEKITGK